MATVPQVSPEEFSISVLPERRGAVVVPAGEIDIATAGTLEADVKELRDRGFDHILIDLRRATFLDSSGLRVLLTLRSDAEHDGHSLKLVPGCAEVQRVFELTSTRSLFDWHDH